MCEQHQKAAATVTNAALIANNGDVHTANSETRSILQSTVTTTQPHAITQHANHIRCGSRSHPHKGHTHIFPPLVLGPRNLRQKQHRDLHHGDFAHFGGRWRRAELEKLKLLCAIDAHSQARPAIRQLQLHSQTRVACKKNTRKASRTCQQPHTEQRAMKMKINTCFKAHNG